MAFTNKMSATSIPDKTPAKNFAELELLIFFFLTQHSALSVPL
jgi:hypothetical protein